MPKIQYKAIQFEPTTLKVIEIADAIVSAYQAQGFDLTLRQLYYQFVAKGYLPNSQKNYAKLSVIINDARLAGLLDWTAIVDRTRNLMALRHWRSPQSLVEQASPSYREDLWKSQAQRVEVWIEKDALVGILDSVCPGLDVPYFSCRGYTSQSEMWAAGQRIVERAKKGQRTVILHLGDHDPSGIDMSRDIKERLSLFVTTHLGSDDFFEVRRIALRMKQIERYNPPPNPAKVTDSRFKKYQEKYGQYSWELDALDPMVLSRLVRRKVEQFVDPVLMQQAMQKQSLGQAQLMHVASHWKDCNQLHEA